MGSLHHGERRHFGLLLGVLGLTLMLASCTYDVDDDSSLSFAEAQTAAENLIAETVNALGLEQLAKADPVVSDRLCQPTDLSAAEYVVVLRTADSEIGRYEDTIRQVWAEAGMAGFVTTEFEGFRVLTSESRDLSAGARIPHDAGELSVAVNTDCYDAERQG